MSRETAAKMNNQPSIASGYEWAHLINKEINDGDP
jgi:hypothetical protein